jgi:alpha-1,3-rhamnosyl/mannosyltransferase
LRLDLFHSPYYIKPYLLPCPSVVTIYDLIPRLYPKYISPWARVIFEMAIHLAIVTSRLVISVSQSAKEDLVRLLGVPPSKVWVTPLGVDSQFCPVNEKAIFNLRQRHDLPEGYILYLGINKPHKNLGRLVEAFAEVKTEQKLVLAGKEDPRYGEVHEVVKQLGLQDRVVFLGQVSEDDLPALYSGATLFVFPSLYEGFGLPLLEAMACGVPVVCSSTSSLPEIAGRAAIMVDPLDLSQWARALERVLGDSNLRASMREEGLKQAALFSWEKTAKGTLAVYRQVLSR